MSAFFSFGTSFVISFRRNCNVEKIEKRQYFCKKKGCSFENLYICNSKEFLSANLFLQTGILGGRSENPKKE